MTVKSRIEDLDPYQPEDLRPPIAPFDIIYLNESSLFETIEPIIQGDSAMIRLNRDKVWADEVPF